MPPSAGTRMAEARIVVAGAETAVCLTDVAIFRPVFFGAGLHGEGAFTSYNVRRKSREVNEQYSCQVKCAASMQACNGV